ncbi:MAG: four helix bundle protein [Patescibacteria group bacterium]
MQNYNSKAKSDLKERCSRLEFKKFYEISLKSANETVYWLNLLRDAGLVLGEKVNPLIVEVRELANMLAAGVLKLKGQKF